jgi:hypothetical protein
MQIQWFGQSYFKIQSKNSDGDVVIATDPYNKEVGLKPSKFQADILTISQDETNHNNKDAINGDPFIVNTPGEYETKGVFIYGIPITKEKGSITVFKINTENINIAHLENINNDLSDEQLDRLGNIDILFLPVGGGSVADAKKASSIASAIEPRIIIPTNYKITGLKEKYNSVDAFVKESGLQSETMDKLKIAKKDLPQDQTKIVILNP